MLLLLVAKGIESVQVTKVGRTYPFSITQEHFSIEGRGLVREANAGGLSQKQRVRERGSGRQKNCRIRRRVSTPIRRWTRRSSGE